MAVSYKVWNFPQVPLRGQVFHVPGAVVDGGLTSGGARISSPDPSGRSVLEIQMSLQVTEWSAPFSSWLMSKTNGQIFRIQLIKTPQICSKLSNDSQQPRFVPWDNTGILPKSSWDNQRMWAADGETLTAISDILEGSTRLRVYLGEYADIIRPGHVIGLGDYSYMIDDIDEESWITVTPPLRKSVVFGETVYLQPYFTGSISNGNEMKQSYEADKVGHIQLGRIVFDEVVVP